MWQIQSFGGKVIHPTHPTHQPMHQAQFAHFFGYLTYQVLFATDTPGRLLPQFTHSLKFLPNAKVPQVVY